ncbi:MAG: hypothetical protein E6G21_02585 [Actinobacteria bacterium]|nr:MAG: hypothetical protein E6G21_02585 [Actinomycetota bacterium]
MVAAYRRGRLLKLVRNPHFRVWSQDAQPDGYADAIVWKLGHAPAAQARAVERGTGDVAFDSEGFSPGLVSELQTRYASQLRGNTLARTTYMFLNTRLPPFNDVRGLPTVLPVHDPTGRRGRLERSGPGESTSPC